MKVKMVIMHVVSGHIWSGDATELTEDELEQAKASIKDNIGNFTYIELGETILPGEFIRQHCVITFRKE